MREDDTRHRKLTTPTTPPETPRSNWLGHLLVGLIVVGVAALLATRGHGLAPGVQPPSGHPAPPAELAGFRADAWMLPADDLLGFVEIPEGAFDMGTDKSRDPLAFDNERWSAAEPQGAVEVKSFFIGRFEVTVAQFLAFAHATGRRVDPQLAGARPAMPAAFVSWPDALAYCRWLEAQLKESPVTPARLKQRLQEGWHVALPSEAEWEKAARGGDGRRYPWGAEARRDRATYAAQAVTAVGSIPCPECAHGLSDMAGNVWEWTRSPYQPYPFDPRDDAGTVGTDAIWVMRGGAFNDSEQNIRTTTRGGADPGVRRPFIGFRLVISPG